MEVLFAILLTALGLYGGMFFIWKGDHHSNFDEEVSSFTSELTQRKGQKQAI